ncbi:WXG100 family type VII secretion target [Umezawaea tangerina]|uniref:Type VII secretion system (Wss) protein ESAT-6 n=1 Tax=Umezawaea tangerina TaxID=84725 RepID=A0A2T0SZX8_9PSEU|nr:WXG100 family type VII secretion target [Umezawaea tangerina]PRY38970.1 type VII secretion system (Wss) protein ESAT-6 [Umezawaea tangerina]
MATYTFDRGMADSVRDQMASVTMALRSELERMDQQVQSTLQDWQDGAKDQYLVAKSQWDEVAARMPNSLHSAEVALSEITDGYLKIEHTGMNAWGGYDVK